MILFWKFLMIAIMVLFFPAAAIVAVKGFHDVFSMFADLAKGSEEDSEE